MEKDETGLDKVEILSRFLKKAAADARMTTAHISLYAALYQQWAIADFQNPIEVYSKDLRPLCKIAGNNLYYGCINELHEWGYLHYLASYNHFLGSLVHLLPLSAEEEIEQRAEVKELKSFRFFLLMDKRDYKIVKTAAADLEAFRQRYRFRILLEDGTMEDLLRHFSSLLNRDGN